LWTTGIGLGALLLIVGIAMMLVVRRRIRVS
jgi:hypothetical protein